MTLHHELEMFVDVYISGICKNLVLCNLKTLVLWNVKTLVMWNLITLALWNLQIQVCG